MAARKGALGGVNVTRQPLCFSSGDASNKIDLLYNCQFSVYLMLNYDRSSDLLPNLLTTKHVNVPLQEYIS